MNILIKSDNESSQSSERRELKLASQLQKLSLKALRSAQNVLNVEIMSSLRTKYEELVATQENMVQFFEFFLYSMLNHIDQMQQVFSIDPAREDYEVLETAAQKSEAEIRKHIRIEQQLKIYLDSLEEKMEEHERKLVLEEQRYNQLFESLREVDEERKEMARKLAKYQEGRDKSKSQSNYATINDQIYKDYYAGRKAKPNNKSRHVIDKYNERARKLSDKKGPLQFAEGSIQINLSNNIVVSKKTSYDQNLSRNHNPISHDNSIRELTKTVQMKQPAAERRPNRKISKYKTEINEGVERRDAERREGRSNSVCN